MEEAFLITTTNHVLAFDGRKCFYRVHSGKGLYYGIAAHRSRIYIACRNAVEGSHDESVRARENGSILVLDAISLAVIDELKADFSLRDVHGMACIDNKLWITCPFDNLVAVYDLDERHWTKWYPASNPYARGRDVNHFNTVAAVEDRLCVVAHNNGSSHLLFYDKSSLDLQAAIQLGRQAHDVFCVNGEIATCSSADGLLLGNSGWILRTGAFPRGIAFGRSSILVGVSQFASREKRHTMFGMLRMFTPEWHYLADYVLPGVGMILAILPISLDSSAWRRCELLTGAEHYSAVYNKLTPGNIYRVGESDAGVVSAPEWHEGENYHRWTASREARIDAVVNLGETKMIMNAISGFPGPYSVDVFANGSRLGSMQWAQPGEAHQEFTLPPQTVGRCRIVFRVPYLWKPSECLLASSDERMLGIGIVYLEFMLDYTPKLLRRHQIR